MMSIHTRFLVVLTLLVAFAAGVSAQKPQAFTEDQLLTICRNIKLLGEDQVADMVEKRGVDFKLREGFKTQLRKLGAGDLLIQAVQKASDLRLKEERETPAI